MPVVFNIHPFTKEWNDDTLQWLSSCHARGMPVYGCTSVKAIATLASMESNVNPFMAASPTYLALSELPREPRVAELQVIIPHHETFRTTIQSPYSSTKG